jgi:hypothetical protein
MRNLSFQKFRENFNPLELSFETGASLLISLVFPILLWYLADWRLWGGVVGACLVIFLFLFMQAVWTLRKLPHLELKPRTLDPTQRKKVAEHLRQYPKRTVSVVITEEAMRDDGASFAKDIESAIANAAWEARRGELGGRD